MKQLIFMWLLVGILAFLMFRYVPPAGAAEPLTREEPVVRMVLQEANTEDLAGLVAAIVAVRIFFG